MDSFEGKYTFYRRKKEDGDERMIAEGRNGHPRILDQSAFEEGLYKF